MGWCPTLAFFVQITFKFWREIFFMSLTPKDYVDILREISPMPDADRRSHIRNLIRTDLLFLIWYGFGRVDIDHPWLIDRVREVELEPDGCLDLWARDHYKSSIITYALTIQDILKSHGDEPLLDKELTFGIFSHTRPIAKAFLRQIMREFESNAVLKEFFPDIVWENPRQQAPKWSEDDGIILKRKTNPKEATIEAWGLVDGQPVSKHFDRLVYDDVVTLASVNTPEMIAKTTEALELSYNLGTKGGKRRFIGTRYHFNDTYRTLIERKTAKLRVHPATDDGTADGEPVFLSREDLVEKRRDQGPYTFSCQMLLNPKADETQGFRREWLRYYDSSGGVMNKYLIVDPANEKRKTSDYTSMFVIGAGADKNYYVLDMIRDRLNLKERTDALFSLHEKWDPLGVGYEKYGKDADIAHIEGEMDKLNYRFDITPLGGRVKKSDRIKGLIPLFEQKRVWFPKTMWKTDYEGRTHDLVDVFIEQEFMAFPVPVHDDMLDCLARVLDEDMNVVWPKSYQKPKDRYKKKPSLSVYDGNKRTWMSV